MLMQARAFRGRQTEREGGRESEKKIERERERRREGGRSRDLQLAAAELENQVVFTRKTTL